ncbi:hypothetical protein I4U23_013034 [Adineta vaga]|nr:hypothetical protein I4U23_013034 [Adineta vaga]
MTNHENQLIVENALDDDNSVVRLSSKMMDKLQFFCGDAVKLKGRKRRQTVCIALSDDSCSDDHIRMNSVIQKNLRVHAGNTITIQEYPRAIYGTRIHVLPFNDTLCDIAEDVLNENLKSYFCDAFRPVYIGDTFTIRIGTDKVEFKVMQTDPSPCCIVAPETVIDCKGEPIHYIEEQYLNNEVDFYDIGGYKDIKKSLQESVQGILKYQNTEYYFKYGLLPSTGILLYGPPGCGKTMLAKALANECDMNLLIIKGPELVCAWGNDPETNLRATFDKARQSAPCILLIDELDYVCK